MYLKKILQSNDGKRLLTNFFSLLSMQGMNYILPLLTMPYLFRVLGVEKYGLVAFALAVIGFFNVFVEYGFNLSATRDIAKYTSDKEKLIEIFSSVLSAKFILLFISFIILSCLIFFINKFNNNWELLYLSFLIVIGNALFPTWFFQGIEEMKYISYLNIIAKLFFTVGIFIFVKSENDYLLQPLLSGLGFIFVGLYSLYFIYKKYQIKFKIQPIFKIENTLREGWDIFLIEFIPNLYNNFSILLLGFVSTMESVGIFSLATNIVDVFNRVIYIMRNITYPYLSKNLSKFKKITTVLIGTGAILSFIIFSISQIIVPFIFGEKANESIGLIYILGLSPLFSSIMFSLGSNRLLLLGKDKVYRRVVIKGSLIGFIFSLILIPLFGAIGASLNLILTRASISSLLYNEQKNIVR